MKSHPDLPYPRQEDARELRKHNHGQMYRLKMVPFGRPPQFGEWLGTEADVRTALESVARNVGGRYYCEMKAITCPECSADQPARVICAL
jgi:hypothetical protein